MAKLPTEDDLKKLSIRGRIAYAARAARRCQPLFTSEDPKHVAAVDTAIRLGEEAADADADADADVYAAADAAYAGGAAAARAADAAAGAARAAYAAANAAAYAYAAYDDADDDPANATDIIEGCIRDYEQLLVMSKDHAGSLGPPIDVKDLGPLWPDGEPEWFMNAQSLTQAVTAKARTAEISLVANTADAHYELTRPLQLLIDPGTAASEDVAELFGEISDLYQQLGGRGLQFTLTDCREPAFEEEKR